MNNKCDCNCCYTKNFTDNGYEYVLDELKQILESMEATQLHLKEAVGWLERRMKKDSIIDDVLSTEYDDEDMTDIADILADIPDDIWQRHTDILIPNSTRISHPYIMPDSNKPYFYFPYYNYYYQYPFPYRS